MKSSARALTKLAAIAMLGGASAPAMAWGEDGHAIVGGIADRLLWANAKAQVQSLLGHDGSLQVASNWADCAKGAQASNGTVSYVVNPRYREACGVFETTAGQAEMVDYVRRNVSNCDQRTNREDCHKQYHYTDVAIQRDAYDRTHAGTSNVDIIATINAAIAVLKGGTAPAPFSFASKREALLVLAHMIGDLHQPLHVGAVYLTPDGSRIDPDIARPHDHRTETRGGNSLTDGGRSLHSLWDSVDSQPTVRTISRLKDRTAAFPVTQGPASQWARTWAGESLLQARSAFNGVTFASTVPPSSKWRTNFVDRPAYLAAKGLLQQDQLAKAGARLAKVLNAIWG